MGISNEVHTPDEESLPLYSNLDYDEANTDAPLTLPEASATPDVVREFLVRLLVNQRKLPLDQARRIAARWNMGSGRELWIYSPAMYNTIFGAEDGWVLYKDVKVLHSETELAKKGFLRRHIARIIFTVLLLWNGSLAIWAATGPESDAQVVFIAAGLFFGGLGLVSSTLFACFEWKRNPEEEAEGLLRTSFFSNNNPIAGHGN